jgi:nitrate/TMAO reductase-like tetraheme cytochrome c subunit
MKLFQVPCRVSLRISAIVLSTLLGAAVVAGFALSVQEPPGRTYNPHGSIKLPCTNCHTTTGWKPIRPFPDFNHASTRYPLEGMHAGLDCGQCHVKLVFSNVGSRCADCHADIHRRQMGNNCEECHTVRGWLEIQRNPGGHQNRFPLMGAHAATQCQDCHKSAAVGLFKGLSTECVSCHQNDYRTATAVDHIAAGFSTKCDTCHRADSWRSGFDHAKDTGFALSGAHSGLQCVQCHIGGKFSGTPADCVGCHLADYNTATNPNHVQGNFPKNCSICHATTAWDPASLDHNNTQFPLTGAHASRECVDCHKNGQYTGLSTACSSCHLTDFSGATDPNHTAAGFSQTCSTCHSTTAWTPAIFDHSTTQFPLTGAHVGPRCNACHASGQYSTLPSTCVSCHLANFNGTTNPNHITAGFPQDCTVCHSTTGWTPALFDHSKSQFPLTGAHTSLQCPACHSNGQYSNLPTTCVSCHLTNFNGATNPNHVSASFPQDCTICHTTAAWTPSIFDHGKTSFPLTGAHTSVQCANCHISGVYAGTPKDCYSCHSSEYRNTTDPNHIAAVFPTTCDTCHTTASWGGATFNHTRFPIYSGSHQGRWATCGDCHANANDYAVFSCITCHEHDKTTMDASHRGIANYVYNSANCYSCHPTGRSD